MVIPRGMLWFRFPVKTGINLAEVGPHIHRSSSDELRVFKKRKNSIMQTIGGYSIEHGFLQVFAC